MGKKSSLLIFVVAIGSIALMAVIRLSLPWDQIMPGYPFMLDHFLLEIRPPEKTAAPSQTAKQILQILEKRMLSFGVKNFSMDQIANDRLKIDIYNSSYFVPELRKLLVQIGSVEFGLLMDSTKLLEIGGAMNRYRKSVGQSDLFYLHPDDEQALIVPVELKASLKQFLETEKAKRIIGNPSLSIIEDKSIINHKNYNYLQIYLVKTYKDINQDHIIDAQVKTDYAYGDQLNFTFDEKGQKFLSDFTNDHIDQRLVIICDGQVIASPVIKEKIADGKLSLRAPDLSVDFQIMQATIKSGLLRNPLHVIKESSEVGPRKILRLF
ncbi:MAG: hypothetical protein PVF56_21185 [Desulfobacterales bacterium]|jgi:preprotein translocase subunit SecD